jgi:hypothetical protein
LIVSKSGIRILVFCPAAGGHLRLFLQLTVEWTVGNTAALIAFLPRVLVPLARVCRAPLTSALGPILVRAHRFS